MKPLVTMPDVLLACGELNKRERVATLREWGLLNETKPAEQ